MPKFPCTTFDDVCPSLPKGEPVIGDVFRIGEPTVCGLVTVCGDWSVASFGASKALFPPSPETIGALVVPTADPTPLIASIEP